MPKTHTPYPLEYRERIIDLVRAGRSPESLAREFEPSAQCIRNWVRQADRDAGRRTDGLTTVERGELQRLRRENATLREERDILKKWSCATAHPRRDESGSVVRVGRPGTRSTLTGAPKPGKKWTRVPRHRHPDLWPSSFHEEHAR